MPPKVNWAFFGERLAAVQTALQKETSKDTPAVNEPPPTSVSANWAPSRPRSTPPELRPGKGRQASPDESPDGNFSPDPETSRPLVHGPMGSNDHPFETPKNKRAARAHRPCECGKAEVERNKAATALLKAIEKNLNAARSLLRSTRAVPSNFSFMKLLNKQTTQLSIIAKWVSEEDFKLPSDHESFSNFCKMEDGVALGEQLERLPEGQQQVQQTALDKKVQELLDFFKNKAQANIREMNETSTERGNQLQQGKKNMDHTRPPPYPLKEGQGRGDLEEGMGPSMEMDARSLENSSWEPSQIPFAEEVEVQTDETRRTYQPYKADAIWVCSPSETPLKDLLHEEDLRKSMGPGILLKEQAQTWLLEYEDSDVAANWLPKLEEGWKFFSRDKRTKPYFGRPSFRGEKKFQLRIEDLSLVDIKKRWATNSLDNENFKERLKVGLVKMNPKIFVKHDWYGVSFWISKAKRDRNTAAQSHGHGQKVSIAIKTGPLTFDRCKAMGQENYIWINFWPQPAQNKKDQRDETEHKSRRSGERTLDTRFKEPVRMWGCYFPIICVNCFQLDHVKEDCRKTNQWPKDNTSCPKCKSEGKKGSDIAHRVNSFSCPWYKSHSNILEERVKSFRGGF